MTGRRWVEASAAGLMTAGLVCATAAVADAVPTYRATYDVHYRNRVAGTSEFSVSRDDDGYRFESVSRLRGLYRLAAPRPVIEVSEFAYDNGRLRPLTYAYEDGSRSGEDAYRVIFDWGDGVATTTRAGETIQSALVPGVLDRGSMQVKLMLDLARSSPGTYTLVDDAGIRVYDTSVDGDETLSTPLGEIVARRLIQQRRGSTRRTVVWAAEDLNFLPIRIEQQRDGQTRVAFHLRSVEWLDEGP